MNEDAIKLIRATQEDAIKMADLRIAFMEDFWGPKSPEETEALRGELIGYFYRATQNGDWVCYFAEVDNKTVGIGGMTLREQPGGFRNISGRVAYIMNMFTYPEYRRKGIARKILRALMADAEAMGITMYELHATSDGAPLYEQEGFFRHTEPTYRKFILQNS